MSQALENKLSYAIPIFLSQELSESEEFVKQNGELAAQIVHLLKQQALACAALLEQTPSSVPKPADSSEFKDDIKDAEQKLLLCLHCLANLTRLIDFSYIKRQLLDYQVEIRQTEKVNTSEQMPFLQLIHNLFLQDFSNQHAKQQQLTHYTLVFLVNLTRYAQECEHILSIFQESTKELPNYRQLLYYLMLNFSQETVFHQHGHLLSCLLLNLTQLEPIRLQFCAIEVGQESSETNEQSQNDNYLSLFIEQFNQFSKTANKLLYQETPCEQQNSSNSSAQALHHEDEQTLMNLYGCVKNLCFQTNAHQMLLANEDFVVNLIWPITGPTSSEMDEEDNEQLPLDLQFLGEHKQRTCNNGLRELILESLLQLCATGDSRERLRELRVYFILRGYYSSEANEKLAKLLENVIDVLIESMVTEEKKK